MKDESKKLFTLTLLLSVMMFILASLSLTLTFFKFENITKEDRDLLEEAMKCNKEQQDYNKLEKATTLLKNKIYLDSTKNFDMLDLN